MIKETEFTYTETMDYREFLEQATKELPVERQDRTSSNRCSLDFTGVTSYQQAINLAKNGWIEGAQKIANASKKLVDQLSTKIERMEFNYNVEGIMFDVGLVCDGIPECWIEPHYTKVESDSNHLVRIMVNRGALGNRATSEIECRGIAIAAFIECLELSGKNVELSICFPAMDDRGNMTTLIVKIKDFDQRLDIDKVAFMLAHPASHRCLKFRWIELLPTKFYKTIIHNYGYTTDLNSDQQKEYDIYFSSIEAYFRYSSQETMEQWIENQLKKQGVTFKD